MVVQPIQNHGIIYIYIYILIRIYKPAFSTGDWQIGIWPMYSIPRQLGDDPQIPRTLKAFQKPILVAGPRLRAVAATARAIPRPSSFRPEVKRQAWPWTEDWAGNVDHGLIVTKTVIVNS